MNHPLRAAFSRRTGLLTRLGPGLLLLALGVFAYRPLFRSAFGLPTRHAVERWFFMPDQSTALVVIGIAGWLLWRRRARLLSLPVCSHRATTAAWVTMGMGSFLWAQLTGTADLLIPSLACTLLAFASARKGRAGCRAVLLPTLVLLLAIPIPVPIRSELVWQLQLWTAKGSAWLMQTAGYDVVLRGVVIRSGEHVFTVIDSCSGLRGIQILTIVALVIRDLFATAGRRQWAGVFIAPWLGFALNVVRVAVVVATTDPQVPGPTAEDHTPQGVAVLLAGTALLYGLGWWTAAAGSRRLHGAAPSTPQVDGAEFRLPWRAAAVWFALLGTVSVTVPPSLRAPTPPQSRIEIPKNHAGWTGEDLTPDWIFVGPVPPHLLVYRRYQKKEWRDWPAESVELFVGFETSENGPGSQLFSSKIAMPGRDWSLDEARPARIWTLGLDAELTVASRGSEHALVYTWRLGDEGIFRETTRSSLGLDFGPFRRVRPRAVVRLTTPLPNDGPVMRDRRKQVLDRFIDEFRAELAKL